MTTEVTRNDRPQSLRRSRQIRTASELVEVGEDPATRKLRIAEANAATRQRQAEAEAAVLKLQAQMGQRWTKDRPFNKRLEEGKEKGFTDMPDYIRKSEAYYAYIVAKRGGKDGSGGERKSAKYQAWGMFTRVAPIFLLILGVISIPVILVVGQNMTEGGMHVFRIKEKTPTVSPAQATTTAVAVEHYATASAYETAYPYAHTPAPTLVPYPTIPPDDPVFTEGKSLPFPYLLAGFVFVASTVGAGYWIVARKRKDKTNGRIGRFILRSNRKRDSPTTAELANGDDSQVPTLDAGLPGPEIQAGEDVTEGSGEDGATILPGPPDSGG